jgi:uncharacterized protein (DUF2267 family)
MLRTKCLSKTSPQGTPSVAGRAWYPFERLRREVDPQHWDLDRFFAAVRSYFPDDPLEAADEEIGEVFRLFENRLGAGAVRHVVGCLSNDVQALWPAE